MFSDWPTSSSRPQSSLINALRDSFAAGFTRLCFCCCIIKAFHSSTELTAPSFNAASISAARRRGNYPANSSRAFNGPADCTPVERRVGALGAAAESGDSFVDWLCSETSTAMTLLPEQYRPPQQGGAQHSGQFSSAKRERSQAAGKFCCFVSAPPC